MLKKRGEGQECIRVKTNAKADSQYLYGIGCVLSFSPPLYYKHTSRTFEQHVLLHGFITIFSPRRHFYWRYVWRMNDNLVLKSRNFLKQSLRSLPRSRHYGCFGDWLFFSWGEIALYRVLYAIEIIAHMLLCRVIIQKNENGSQKHDTLAWIYSSHTIHTERTRVSIDPWWTAYTRT